jgi:radical SAM superfamily enzyme YgiQ (UPF0313 family)
MQASSITPQLGVGYLASALRAADHRVGLVHSDAARLDADDVVRRVMRDRPDVVGFTVVTMAYEIVRALCRRLRDEGYTGAIILGGNHVTALPELSLRQTGATAIVRGEGERTLPALLAELEAGRAPTGVSGVTWSDGEQVHENPPVTLIEDLDSIPFPAWDLMPPKTFPYAPHQLFFKRFPVAPVTLSRGCPFQCTYCASQGQWGRTWRYRSIDNVMEEITLLVRRYGVRELHFEDDEFLGKEQRILELCDRLCSANLGLVWSLPNGVRTNAVNDRLLAAMARAGCYEVGLGIDAPLPHQQKRVQKPRAEDAAERAIAMVRKHGMEARGYWILGFDVDGEDDVRRSIDHLVSLPAEFAAIGVAAPLPGSPDFETFRQSIDDLETFDWQRISYFKALDTPHIPRDRLQALLREAVLRFYLRPRQMWAIAKRLKMRQVAFISRGLYRYLTGSFALGGS